MSTLSSALQDTRLQANSNTTPMFFKRLFGSKQSKTKPDRKSQTPTIESHITCPEPPREFRLVTDTELGRRQDQIIANLRQDRSVRPAPPKKEYKTKPFYIAPSEEKLSLHGIKVEVVDDDDECYHPAPSLFVHTEHKISERPVPRSNNRAGTPFPNSRPPSRRTNSVASRSNSIRTVNSTRTVHSTRTTNSTRRANSSSRRSRPATGTITIGFVSD